MLFFLALGWIACGVLAAGWMLATMLAHPLETVEPVDRRAVLILAIFGGPMVLVFALVGQWWRHGWRLR